MNWLKRIAQKSMPLPVSVPAGERENMGIERMDTKMTQETADRLRQQYPGIEYGGAGMIGIALKTGPNELLKITHDWGEVNAATYAFENPMNWVVPILEEPQMIQDNPPMWGIRMKEIEPIVNPELNIFISQLSDLYDKNTFPSLEIAQTWHTTIDEEELIQIYAQMKYILEQNRQTLWLGDIHGGNVGWDDDGNLKVFDLGPGNFVE